MEFKLFGTKIYVSFLFWCLVCFMLALDRTGLIIPLLASVLLHECAHLLFMYLCGSQPKSIRLIPASVQIIRGLSKKENAEIYIAAAGPIANLIVALILLVDYLVFKGEGVLKLCLLNLSVATFNLLPLWGLDGGTILSHIISRYSTLPFKGERVVRIITLFFGVFFFGAGIFFALWHKTNLSFFAVALYLIISSVVRQ